MFVGLKNSGPKRKDVNTSPPQFGQSTTNLPLIPTQAFKASRLLIILIKSIAGKLLIYVSNFSGESLLPLTSSITFFNKK